MEAGRWGRPGFNFSSPAMNFPRHMAGPRMNPGFGMAPPNFSSRNRPPAHWDIPYEYDDNYELHGNETWADSEPFDSTQMMQRRIRKKKGYSGLKQYLKKVDKDTAKNPEQKPTKNSCTTSKTSNGAANNPQNQKPKKSGAQKPQQPDTPAEVSLPADVEVTQEEQIDAPNGDVKEGDAAAEATDGDVPTQPHKKLKTEETSPPAKQSSTANSYGWRGDASATFSCSLCQYHTEDEKQIQTHFYSPLHKEVLKHLSIFFPRERVNFLQEYLLYKKRKRSVELNNNVLPHKYKFKGTVQDYYLQRVQAVQCRACDVLIPDVSELLAKHVKSEEHQQNSKLIFRKIKIDSLAAAKEILVDKDVLEMLQKYMKKRNPFKDVAACSSQGSGTHEILVAEEDEVDIVDDTDDEDVIVDARDGQEVPMNRNEGPADKNKDSGDKMRLPSHPEMIDPADEEEEEEAAEAP